MRDLAIFRGSPFPWDWTSLRQLGVLVSRSVRSNGSIGCMKDTSS
jgi:hypothetical protein